MDNIIVETARWLKRQSGRRETDPREAHVLVVIVIVIVVIIIVLIIVFIIIVIIIVYYPEAEGGKRNLGSLVKGGFSKVFSKVLHLGSSQRGV